MRPSISSCGCLHSCRGITVAGHEAVRVEDSYRRPFGELVCPTIFGFNLGRTIGRISDCLGGVGFGFFRLESSIMRGKFSAGVIRDGG